MRRARPIVAGAALLLLAPHASAQDERDSDLHRPERLTVGVADDLLGQMSPDGKTLYFVSNRDTTNQLFARDVADGRVHQLFDDDADITWPRISPDGRSLLYISFRESASGELCVRRLPDGGQRRCLQHDSTALQAEWIDSSRIALVSRQSIQGDLRVLDVSVGGSLSARALLDRNLTSPAVSPDGHWMVYLPVERTVAQVGPAFAARAASRLEAQHLGSSSPPVRLPVDLPGQTGQPVFAKDGKSLYIVQFFTDTNHDGTVDASDHGVLFRVPISFTGDAATLGPPEQLTETSWNCEYPAPSTRELIATCSQDASLDVYSLPLDGEVPASWTPAELDAAEDNATTRVEQQLLASRRLSREPSIPGKRKAMLDLVILHLQLEEFRAAEFYAGNLDRFKDDSTAGIAMPLKTLVEQRRASRRREQGRMMEGFSKEARERLEKLKPEASESPMAEDLIHLVRSEIADSIGDKGLARTELEAVTVDQTTPEAVVEAYYQHADGLYRELDDREALVKVCRQLSANRSLQPDDQLRFARAAVRAMVRGLARDEADARLVRERAGVAATEGELLFAIDLERALAPIRDANTPQAVIDALIALYEAQKRPGRRRELMEDAVRKADDANAESVLEALAQHDITDVERGTPERRDAERLFRRAMTGRAYRRAAEKRYDDARADFDAIVEQTNSYEAIVGAIDMRLKKGESRASIEALYEKRGLPVARANFARAYLIARRLPELEGAEHARAVARGLAALGASWSELKDQRIAEALHGALLHEDYIETGDLDDAEKANVHYLVALELVGNNARFRAMILGELGILHTDVGNYRIALSYLLDRDKLPYSDNVEGLDIQISKAEAQLHVGKAVDAAATAERALGMTERNPALKPYRLLALDRAAVNNLAADKFARALALYDEEVPLADAAPGALAERNRIVVRLSRAAAAVGAKQPARALTDLDEVDRRLAIPKLRDTLRWPHSTPEHVVRQYRLISAGLRANANGALGHLDAEAQALDVRQAILDEKFGETARAESEEKQMLAETEIAVNAGSRHDAPTASLWLGKALALGDDLHGRNHDVTDPAQLDVLRIAAEMTLSMKTDLVPDLAKRIDAVAVELMKRRDPLLMPYQRWFEIYGALVGAAPDPGTPAAPSSSP